MSIERFFPFRFVGAAILCALGVAVAAYVEHLAAAEPFSAEGITVVDGDTIKVAKLHLGWGVALVDQTIRAADYDAWESSKRRSSVDVTDAEVQKGKRAAAVLAELVRSKRLRIEPYSGRDRDVYGRLLARWYIVDDEGEPPVSVAKLMKDSGHCRD